MLPSFEGCTPYSIRCGMVLRNVGKNQAWGEKVRRTPSCYNMGRAVVLWIIWSLGSPDLTPLHFLWGDTKVRMVVPSELPNLKLRCDSFDYRLNVCHATGGAHIECLRGLGKTCAVSVADICMRTHSAPNLFSVSFWKRNFVCGHTAGDVGAEHWVQCIFVY